MLGAGAVSTLSSHAPARARECRAQAWAAGGERPDEHPQGFPRQKTAGFFLHGLTPVQTSACSAVVKAPSVRLVLLVALPCRSVLLSVLLCEYSAGVLSVPCLGAQEMLC